VCNLIAVRCWKPVVNVMEIVDGKGDLLQMVIACHTSCGFSRCLNRRQEKGDQHSDNRNDNEKFNKRKGCITFHALFSKKH